MRNTLLALSLAALLASCGGDPCPPGSVVSKHVEVDPPPPEVQGARFGHHSHSPGKSILAWWKSIETASEIHCIDSSVLHLVEQLQPTGKLFYHKYARPQRENHKLRHPWIVLE